MKFSFDFRIQDISMLRLHTLLMRLSQSIYDRNLNKNSVGPFIECTGVRHNRSMPLL